MDKASLAPCGMNCALCCAYQAQSKPCPGCRSGSQAVRRSCSNCGILHCPETQTYCFACSRFPCEKLKALDARYRARYGMSMLENLREIAEFGEEEFLRRQRERYTCPGCGKLLTVHRSGCMHCASARSSTRNSRGEPNRLKSGKE